MVTITYENLSSEYNFEIKLQTNYDKHDQSFEQQQKELWSSRKNNTKNQKRLKNNWFLSTQK